MCPRCGGEVAEECCKGDGAFQCQSCGEDLYARPAMSYAEREGLPRNLPKAPARTMTGGLEAEFRSILEPPETRRGWLKVIHEFLVAIGWRSAD